MEDLDLDDIIEAFRLFDAIFPCLVFLKFLKSTNSPNIPVNVFKVPIFKPDRASHT